MPRLPCAPLLVLALAACTRPPRDLVAGTDVCDFCRMTIADVRLGAQLQVHTGRIHTFDAVECLASFYLDRQARDDVRGVWVADYETARMVPADSAVFLHESRLRSPMGRSLVAFAPGTDARALAMEHGGSVLRWSEVLDLIRTDRLRPGADTGHAHADTADRSARATGSRGPV